MHAQLLTVSLPLPGAPTPLPLSPEAVRQVEEALTTTLKTMRRALDPGCAEAGELEYVSWMPRRADPGALEYASWIRRLRDART